MWLLKSESKVEGRIERLFHSGTNAGWEVMRIHSEGHTANDFTQLRGEMWYVFPNGVKALLYVDCHE